jgi:CBS domain-containing protein
MNEPSDAKGTQMSTVRLQPPESLLASLTVADAMHRGIVTCSPLDDLRQVATAMAENEIHCVVAIDAGPPGEDDDRLWGIVSDIDLMRGIGSTVSLDAGNLAALEVVTITPGEELARAAQLMAEHDVAHLVVVDDTNPVGVISTLDIARAAARRPKG